LRAVNIEPWLPLVRKPSRYIDHEINAARKPWQKVNFCFAFPDVYEVGISHLGLKILYSIINALPDCMADRCYLPWTDMIAIMRERGIPLFGLESRIALQDFDAIGITLQSELTFTNVLETISLSGVPILWSERGEDDPLIIAGGPCATNPLPLGDFFDVFFVGEAEEGISEIAGIMLDTRLRSERLARMAELESCYVPALHNQFIPQGWRVKSRKYAGFSSNQLIHQPQLLPWQLATHNRCVAEIMRGCSRGCRFCHAGYFYRPVRERPPGEIVRQLCDEIRLSGWDEAGLLSLSSSDYGCLKELLNNLLSSLDTNKTHVSLPSLRVDSLDDEIVDLMRKLGREGLTIAPEAGSERLRRVINKNLSEEQILAGVQTALDLGWQKVKLYFMVGLPHETEEDIEGIIDLINKINNLGKRRLQINVTLSPFVPKPFTPFQWAAMLPADMLLQRCVKVKQAFYRARSIKIKYHDIENSILEAVFSRGDQRCAELLKLAWQKGALFDGWHECFNFSFWREAAADCGLDLDQYLREKQPGTSLPWDFVDLGICAGFLKAEWDKACREESTPDCRELCSACGICDDALHTDIIQPSPVAGRLIGAVPPPRPRAVQQRQFRYRIYYSKSGVLRFISHLDWMRMLFRLIGQASLQTVFTQGFSPHPKASLCPPLPLGVESACEYVDLSFYQAYTANEIMAGFSGGMIPEFQILGCEPLTAKAPIPWGERVGILIPERHRQLIVNSLAEFSALSSRMFTKSTEKRSKTYDLKQIVGKWHWNEDQLQIEKSLASPSLYDVLTVLLGMGAEDLYALRVSREGWIFPS
jgi:radical SAM family uncharacterized protein/radical SAM-linked protein